MAETSLTLLQRLRLQTDAGSWQRFVDIYTPLIRDWLRRQDVSEHDADDLVQEVLGVVVRELPRFQHDQRTGAFRCWLRTVTVHRLRNFWRSRHAHPVCADSEAERRLAELEDNASPLSRMWDAEHDRHVLQRLLELTRPEFNANVWRVFERVALQGAAAADVAAAEGMSVNAVLLVKSRVLRRLRQEAAGLVE